MGPLWYRPGPQRPAPPPALHPVECVRLLRASHLMILKLEGSGSSRSKPLSNDVCMDLIDFVFLWTVIHFQVNCRSHLMAIRDVLLR